MCAVDCVSRDKLVQVLNQMKTGQSLRASDVLLELLAASGKVGIQIMTEL